MPFTNPRRLNEPGTRFGTLKLRRNLTRLRLFSAASIALLYCGCKADTRQDTVIASVTNPSHTHRASILLRQYWVDGKFDTAPTTYVLVDAETG